MDAVRLLFRLPLPGKIIFLGFAAVPVLALHSGALSLSGFFHGAALKELLVLSTFVFLPIALCASLLLRPFLFIPLYGFETVCIFLYGVMRREHPLEVLLLLRYFLILVLSLGGFLIGYRDFLYPLMSKDRRRWRRHERIPVNFPATIQVGILGREPLVPAVMQNCSNSGMALLVHERNIHTVLAEKKVGDRIVAHSFWAERPHAISGEIVRFVDGNGYRVFGVQVDDRHTMTQFVEWAKKDTGYQSRPEDAAQPFLPQIPTRKASYTVILWALSLSISLGFTLLEGMFY